MDGAKDRRVVLLQPVAECLLLALWGLLQGFLRGLDVGAHLCAIDAATGRIRDRLAREFRVEPFQRGAVLRVSRQRSSTRPGESSVRAAVQRSTDGQNLSLGMG